MITLLDIAVNEKRYGEREVLRNLRVQLVQGEVVSLIGASGCGKSTLLAIAAGLDRTFRGSIHLDGKLLSGVSRDIGFIFQEPRLFPWLTVAENVSFELGRSGVNDPRVTTLLEEVGLQGYADVLPKQLSGGQAQRVAIARGLFTHPRVLLLDEPFSAVDAFIRMKLQDLLIRVAQQHALTVLLVTHDIDEALYLSDRILMLDTGPAAMRAEFPITLLRPRQRADLHLVPLKTLITEQLHATHAL
ncbi:ABC transporter ATP-binding protein [Undibacterium sp.]|uniref:ABC transporter ATP-binding protein n=1 Tax=Undibacterium sp. TaxID=1914977 RepID=UPI00374D0211